MAKLSDEKLAEKDLLDTVRTVKRLQHRIALRRELNEIEEPLLEQQRAAIRDGLPFRLDVAGVLQDEVGEVS